MQQFFSLISSLWTGIFNVLDGVVFTLYNFNVSLLDLMLVILVIGFVVSLYWRGAKV